MISGFLVQAECAEHTAITVATRGGFAERVDNGPIDAERGKHATQGNACSARFNADRHSNYRFRGAFTCSYSNPHVLCTFKSRIAQIWLNPTFQNLDHRECAEHTVISVATRGGFAERVDNGPDKPKRVKHASRISIPQILLVKLDIVIPQYADILLFERSLGVMFLLVADVISNLFDR